MPTLTPPVHPVLLDDRRHDVLRLGSGAPVIVLINGAGGPVDAWFRLLPLLDGLGTLFAYNRPGIGRSAPPQAPQTSAEVVRTLRRLLAALRLAPPYLLVAHSLGGLHAQWFARAHPQEVGAVVLLDATAPQDIALMQSGESALQRGLRRLIDRWSPPDPLGETQQAAISAAALQALPPFPPLPLRVITGARPALRWLTPAAQLAGRAQHQQELARLSPCGRQLIAARSGHFPQFTEPALVAAAIRALAAGQAPTARVMHPSTSR
ncbi:alpha/beta fold hydrolase [Aquincola sp. S2]|uniref:Alpha/beta fold hydrolase n=1 Tax=Pseudaquabacterium terrae TaxID=2732868 RepID=A0ABX2EEI2_9BURK|nr:alpha/beta hydrolase family protein [Aquabacterium terrae]NRF67025.1 alpha/beta fold hydrolase [Aquabacterium terrae]